MNGKLIVGGLVGLAAIAGAGLWYSIQFGYYHEVSGVEDVMIAGDPWPVSNYRGIDGTSSPLKLRGCFTVDWDYVPVDTWDAEATPLRAPFWFSCFDAGQISRDIASDAASVVAADVNHPFGFTTFIAQYPDGRAYLWRQINECGTASFEGTTMPPGCVEPASAELPEPTNDTRKVPGLASGGVPVEFEMRLVLIGGADSEAIVTRDLRAISDESDPHSLYACFSTEGSIPMLTETFEVAEDAAPKPPAADLPCFDAETLAGDLKSGAALAFVGARDIWPGVDRLIAIYDDGRAFAWHQRTN